MTNRPYHDKTASGVIATDIISDKIDCESHKMLPRLIAMSPLLLNIALPRRI